jgi:carboxyl-terminal processing protease
MSPLPSGPAVEAGVLDGDVLLAVDGDRLAASLSLDDVIARVRGPIGTQVTITVRHADGSEESYTLTRQRIEIPSVTWQVVDGQPDTGLVEISRFSDKTPDEVAKALDELLAQGGATRLVLDLRNNGGGILESAVGVAAHFLDGGVVMYETQRNAPEKEYAVPANPGLATQVPLVVLVNGNTASAAEIVAGALLDSGRAPLVGQPTYGKGSVQLVYDLSDGSSLHVTAYRWYTPARRELEQGGLPPTYLVEPAADGTDAELGYALELLRSQALAPAGAEREP